MMGPDYKGVKVNTPKEFSEQKTTAQMDLKDWWKNFHDPSLDCLIQKAIENNYDLQIACEKIEQARARYNLSKADLYPEIDVTAAGIRSKISKNLSNSRFLGTRVQNFFQLGFDASWELDFFGKLRRQKNAAQYETLRACESRKNVYITLLADVARTYIDLIAIKKILKRTEDKQLLQKKVFHLTDSLFQSGLQDEIILKQETIVLEQIHSDLTDLNTQYKQIYHRLAALLGLFPEDLSIDIAKNIPIIKGSVSAGLPSELLRRRPDILEAERSLAKETELIGAKIAKRFPSISLTGNILGESQNLNNIFQSASETWRIGPTISWPLINFGRITAQVNEQKSKERQALLFYKQTVINAFEDVENALVAYFEEEKNTFFKTSQVKSEKRKTTLTQDLYISGLESEISTLNQKKNLIDRENELIISQKNLSNNLIAIYKALGGGF